MCAIRLRLKGAKITAHSGDPGATGANLFASTPASFATAWGAAVDGAGADTGKAVSTGTTGDLLIPASTTVTHYGIWNGSTFLRGELLDGSITVNGTPVLVRITPKTKYS
ncbi:hypothetical protein GOEFS_035_00040 [Gordonia effusa NBRC 100432]|uniref:Uncharacterized protein n=2 Tax=Gordonia effusa TaxID=263908 RepID=H0QXC2_9ACTN|nr:hypothetical protein GOEFS_035_00040 [Gordonia effusa NBRC 100432]